jgi:hypothetical protein
LPAIGETSKACRSRDPFAKQADSIRARERFHNPSMALWALTNTRELTAVRKDPGKSNKSKIKK